MLPLLILGSFFLQAGAGGRTDLELYQVSLGLEVHDHPIGQEGWRLNRAERTLEKRRRAIIPWLQARYGRDRLEEARCAVRDCEGTVSWIGGPSVKEEWQWIRRMDHALDELEARRRKAERPN
jgi:hypothetical protein